MDNPSTVPLWNFSLLISLLIGWILLSAPVDAQMHNVRKLGNDVKQSSSSAGTGGIVFLLNEIDLPMGVVFAFEAYFVKTQPVRFQVWRPVVPPAGAPTNNSDAHYFRLVGEMKVLSTVERDTRVAYIASRVSDMCIVSQVGDRLGIYEEGDVGAVGYQFSSRNPMVLSYKLLNDSVPAGIGDTVLFSTLTFPYVFSFSAYVDTALSSYSDYRAGSDFVTCSRNLNINKLAPASTLPPVTGEPGATGPEGPVGPAGPVGPRGEQGPTGPQGPIGQVGPIGEMGAIGQPGQGGPLGATGPMGRFGSTGPRGENGATGPQGRRGPPGPQGKAVVTGSTDSSSDFFSNPITVLILLIWLAIVTILLILILILVITMRRRRQEAAKDINRARTNASFTSGLLPAGMGMGADDNSHDWMGTMKEDSEAGYANDTIIVDGKRKSRREHALNNNMSASTPRTTTTNLNGRSKSTSSDTPEMTSTLRSPTYEQPPDIMASSQPPVSPIPSPPTSPTSPTTSGPVSPITPRLTSDFPFENEISSTTDTITRRYDNQGNLSQDNIHMVGN